MAGTDRLARWYDEGRERGERWLEIGFDAQEHTFEPAYHSDPARPEPKQFNSWTTYAVIDLNRPLAEQHVDVDHPW